MVSETDIITLRRRLERARLLFRAGRLSEDIAWRLVRRTTMLLERAGGSDYEPTLDVIYTLVASLWSNTRQQGELMRIKRQLNDARGLN